MGAEKSPIEVNLNYLFPLFEGQRIYGSAKEHGGVVDQHVNAPKSENCGFDHVVYLSLLSEVSGQRNRFVSCREQLLNSFFCFSLRGVIMDHHSAAACSQGHDNGFANTFGSTGDERDFVLQVHSDGNG